MERDLQYARIGARQVRVGVSVLIAVECGHVVLPANCDEAAPFYSTRARWGCRGNSKSCAYSPSSVKCTLLISLMSAITIARVPLRSKIVPLACTYLPTKGINFCC